MKTKTKRPTPITHFVTPDGHAGLFWHVHHGSLAEYCWSDAERKRYIRNNKPPHEQRLRLRLLKPIARNGAPKWLAHITAASLSPFCRYLTDAERLELEQLHDEQCPGCPWNGHTIFP